MLTLFIDGGCSGNYQKDPKNREMVSVVVGETGEVIREEHISGGSNNIAEFIALMMAMEYATEVREPDVTIITDSRNNIAWFNKTTKFSKKINDPEAVAKIKEEIEGMKKLLNVTIEWCSREVNMAGLYLDGDPEALNLAYHYQNL